MVFAYTQKYAGKVIFVKKDHQLSLQYQNAKDETLYVHEGKRFSEIEGDNDQVCSMDFREGQCIRISPGKKHRVKAIKDMTIFEVSTPELDDIVRIDDDYGRSE